MNKPLTNKIPHSLKPIKLTKEKVDEIAVLALNDIIKELTDFRDDFKRNYGGTTREISPDHPKYFILRANEYRRKVGNLSTRLAQAADFVPKLLEFYNDK